MTPELLSADKAAWIQDWVASTTASLLPTTATEPRVPARPASDRHDDRGCRATKRARRRKPADGTSTTPFNAPVTPPSSAAMSEATPSRSTKLSSRKRLAAEVDADGDPTPKPPSRLSLPPPKRSRASSPTKKNPCLELLEKPVKIVSLDDVEGVNKLPKDARELYDALLPAVMSEEIIPSEARDQVVAIVGAKARRHHFRPPATDAVDAGAAATLHDGICRVLQKAKMAKKQEQEAGWNHLVHTPVLELVYTAVEPDDDSGPPRFGTQPASARFVPAMTVSILKRYVPHVTSGPVFPGAAAASSEPSSVDDLACSISDTSYHSDPFHPTPAQSRGDSKKVDYVLAIDVRKGAPLSIVFDKFVKREAFDVDLAKGILPHVNHTMNAALQWSPIFCSLETKLAVGKTEAMLQLGIWVEAWQNRMQRSRQYILKERPDLDRDRSGDRMPSALLVEVLGHEWRLYIACVTKQQGVTGDVFDMVTLFGPLKIGSTEDLIGLYQLVTSLQLMKQWGETTFQASLEDWFLCSEVLPASMRPSSTSVTS